MHCRHCKQPLHHEFADLIASPPANSFLTAEQLLEPETYYPLKLYVCSGCYLVQVDEHKKAEDIFDSNYVYFSSYSKSWLAHAKQYVDMMVERFGYHEQSFVIEVASNDGYLLQYFKEKNVPVLGIEPTRNTAAVAALKGIPSLNEYFGSALARQLSEQKKKANLIVGNNVLAHVPDIDDFVEGLKIALRRNGVITLEFPHLLRLVEECQFDTIYHEHFSYLSFTTVKHVFESHGLQLFDVEELPTHGGSLRIFAKHKKDAGKAVSPRVTELLTREEALGITTMAYYRQFQARMDEIKYNFLDFLMSRKRNNQKVIGYGAAAKGNTLLNYCGVMGNDLIRFVVDASPYKQNKFLPGSHIPVYSEDHLRAYQPDYVIIFPWNLKKEITEQLAYIREWGGKFVTVVPQLQVFDRVDDPAANPALELAVA
jgi:2-polyprenyl-3-methyl-5-hydroxy-6-metoxy-1,4-benzoquinol methylase